MPCWVGKKARKVYSGDIEGFKLANEASDLPCQEKVNGLCCWKVGLKCLIQTIKFDQRILVASYMWWHLQWLFIRPYLSNIFIITSCTLSYTGFPLFRFIRGWWILGLLYMSLLYDFFSLLPLSHFKSVCEVHDLEQYSLLSAQTVPIERNLRCWM